MASVRPVAIQQPEPIHGRDEANGHCRGGLMLNAGRQQRSGAAATGQIRRWVEEHFGADEQATVLVTEFVCHEPGCPPIETVIALLGGKASRTWKIPCSAVELSADDIATVLARPPNMTCKPHPHRDGCCGPPPQTPADSAASP
jgi:nitrate reductase delta subunit